MLDWLEAKKEEWYATLPLSKYIYHPGRSLPLAAVPHPRPKKHGKRVCFSGVGAEHKKGCQNHRNFERG